MAKKPYLTNCSDCGSVTTKKYAAANGGKCKTCVTGVAPPKKNYPDRNARMIDAGWEAYAREEGHYDLPDWA